MLNNIQYLSLNCIVMLRVPHSVLRIGIIPKGFAFCLKLSVLYINPSAEHVRKSSFEQNKPNEPNFVEIKIRNYFACDRLRLELKLETFFS